MLHFCCLSDLSRVYASLDTRNPINDKKKVPSARMCDEGPDNCTIGLKIILKFTIDGIQNIKYILILNYFKSQLLYFEYLDMYDGC